MNFSFGVIASVGILVAISIGFIASDPSAVIEPRVISIQDTTPKLENPPQPEHTPESESISVAETEPEPIPEPTPVPESEPTPVEASSSLPIATGVHQVTIAEGAGSPGCEETNECFLPSSISISVGDTVTWNNPDTAAHTVTSGNISDGHNGIFDSSLFMSGETFSYTFENPGTFDYFCMVHPWMTGQVIVTDAEEMVVVEESQTESTPEPEPIAEPTPAPEPIAEPTPAPEPTPVETNVSLSQGAGAPGCEETNECYIPYEITIAAGTTVTWSNDDTAAHTVTSGNINAGPTGVFDSGLFMAGETFSYTFENPGTFDYFCMVHPWMTGVVNVS